MEAEHLDIERRDACRSYLISAGHARRGELIEHRPLSGGVSSRTVLVTFTDGRRWVLKQALAKLRVAADWFSDPSRVHREALGMRVLGELAPPGSIPRLIFDDETHHVLGMEAVPEPHENWKSMLLEGRIKFAHALEFGALLGAIHVNGFARRRELEPLFRDTAFFESLRIEPYSSFTAARESRAAAFLTTLIADTRASKQAPTHGDFSPKNVLVLQDRPILLDHEVIHWGDPLFDLGFALTHLLSKWHHLPAYRDKLHFALNGFLQAYFQSVTNCPWVAELGDRGVRHTLGCLLARVAGRSPLEYLPNLERNRQHDVVVRLINDVPQSMHDLIERFEREIIAAE